jgi:Ca2+-binding RTX toxin-like protein
VTSACALDLRAWPDYGSFDAATMLGGGVLLEPDGWDVRVLFVPARLTRLGTNPPWRLWFDRLAESHAERIGVKHSLLLTAAALAMLALAPAASSAVINGTAGDDTLVGTRGADTVHGFDGDDVLAGNARRDVLEGDNGSDTLTGDAGNDLLRGGKGHDTAEGGRGKDTLRGGLGLDVLEGGPGNDFLYTGDIDGLPDVVDCGTGRDRATIREGDVVIGCEKVRRLPARPTKVAFERGTQGADNLNGSDGRDYVLGLGGADVLSGLLRGDFLFGQRGADTLRGDEALDRLWGGVGNDQQDGGPGNDWLWGGAGADRMNGGPGNDRLFAVGQDGKVDRLDCGDNLGGPDRAWVRPNDITINCEVVEVI